MENSRLNKYQISGGYRIALQIDLVFCRSFLYKGKFSFVMPVRGDYGMVLVQLGNVFLQRKQSLTVAGIFFLLQCQCL